MSGKSPFKIDSKRTILPKSGFTENDANLMIRQLHELNQEEGDIFLHLNGSGGSFPGTKKLYDNILISANDVNAVVAGDAYSAFAIMLQACKKRYATKHSKIHLHFISYPIYLDIRYNSNILVLKDQINSELKTLRENNEILLDILEARIKSMTRAQITKLVSEDRDLTPTEALKLGLIDEII